MKQNDQLIEIIHLLYQKRRYILWTCLTALIVSVVCSLILPNYYQASTTFYAASPDLAQPAPVGSLEHKQEYYGSDNDLDRLFSLASSHQLSAYLISKYDLYKHYKIDSTSAKARFKIQEKFNKYYNTKKTKFDALELSIEDQDPRLAAKMANDARIKINDLAQEVIKENQSQLIAKYENNIAAKGKEMTLLSDSLSRARIKYGVYNTISQSEVLTELLTNTKSSLRNSRAKYKIYKNSTQYQDSLTAVRADISGLEGQLSDLEKQLSLFNEGLGKVVILEVEQREFIEQLSFDKERLKQLKAAYSSPFKALLTIEEASVPVQKSRPKRSLYVIAALLLSFTISVFTILLLHSFKDIIWNIHED